MIDILARAGCFVAIIFLGAVLRHKGFFKKEDFPLLSRIVVNITLPAAIICNFAGRELDPSLFILILVGFGYGVILSIVAYFLNRRQGKAAQAFAIVNSAGVNISNFVLPFAQGYLGSAGVMAVSLFDVGNGMICLGGSYGVAEAIQEKQKHFSIRPVLRSVGKSVPIITYLTMCLLALLHISLPETIVDFARIIGNANAFLAMLMLGVGFQIDRRRIFAVLRVLLPRYAVGLVLAVLCYFLLPVEPVYHAAIFIPFLGPVGTAAPAFTARLKGDYELASAINSFSILISTVLIVAALMIIL